MSLEERLKKLSERPEVHRDLHAAILVEHAIRRGEAELAANGALVAVTGSRTGRSPNDKFIVEDSTTADKVAWGKVNQPIEPAKFGALLDRALHYLEGRDLFVQNLFAGADPAYRLPIRVITELAWHSLFARQLFVRPRNGEAAPDTPAFTVVAAPNLGADPARDGTNSDVFVSVDFTRRVVLVVGTHYAGEIKKSVFTIMNYLLPERDVFPMHCSANIGEDGSTALFFGLSGTGKTTLSADPSRRLIGDDEHGWSDDGVFNFEGGCYAKCIRLSRENEPQIYNALRFGSVLENVILKPGSKEPDYDADTITENTRAAYPVDFIDNAVIPGIGGHPKHVVFLTADAFGVLPPIAKLSPEQAMYHFLSGYTAKVAGTEAGMGSEPQATFSTCFGAPFLPRAPRVYAQMLGERLERHGAHCWLVNTGWTGGKYGVGKRMPLKYTRAMVRAAINGTLEKSQFETESSFGLSIPRACPEVPAELLNPRNAWADKSAYDKAAAHLAELFAKNFERFDVPDRVREAGPAPVAK